MHKYVSCVIKVNWLAVCAVSWQ